MLDHGKKIGEVMPLKERIQCQKTKLTKYRMR